MSVVGIDFGNANTVIAAAGRGGVDVILNGNSNRLNPCMVSFGECRSKGEQAQTKAISNYKNTITNMKRLVGLAFDDPRAQAEMARVPYKCVPIKHQSGGPDSVGVKVMFNNEETVCSIEAVAGMMVKHLGRIAAASAAASSPSIDNLGHKAPEEQFFPQDWVIAIPGYYTDAQRRGFLAGCEIAGITGVQRLMHETTATALAYGIFKDIRKEFKKDEPTNVMFIDMGASAYQVAIVAFEPGKLIVKSTSYDADLGGRDFDLLLANYIAEQFEAKYKGKLSGKPMDTPKVRLKLLAAAEKAKKTLSPHGVKEARINLECIMDDYDFGCTIKADEYEKMCQPLLARLPGPIEKALAEAKLTTDDLASVEIVGGSTRIGSVKQTLIQALGGKQLSTTMNADEAVGRGAALQSAILSPRFKVLPYEIQEYQPFPVKVAWDEVTEGAGMEIEGDADGDDLPANSVTMFDRGLNFPVVRRVTLRRSGDFGVNATYDEEALKFEYPANVSTDIATFAIKAPAGDVKKVRVNVKEDIHGIISLSSAQMVEEIEEEAPPKEEGDKKEGEEAEAKAEDEKKKKKIKRTNLEFSTSRPLDWTKAEIDSAYEIEVSMSNVDRVFRETSDKRNELESYIYDMRDKINSETGLSLFATDEEKTAFSDALEKAENWLYEEGFDATKSIYAEKLDQLKKLGNPIETRHNEAAQRPGAFSALQKYVEQCRNWLNNIQTDEKYKHITDEEREDCHLKCDEISSWVYDQLDKQGSLPQNVDPVVTVQNINDRSKELQKVMDPIIKKPAPKKEEKKPEPMVEEPDDTKKDEAEPMETDKPAEEAEPMEGVDVAPLD